jgi:hypothetical protein
MGPRDNHLDPIVHTSHRGKTDFPSQLCFAFSLVKWHKEGILRTVRITVVGGDLLTRGNRFQDAESNVLSLPDQFAIVIAVVLKYLVSR